MAYAHVYVIPDQGGIRGGDLYDKWGNLTFFADVTALVDKTRAAVDKSVTVKQHSRNEKPKPSCDQRSDCIGAYR